jgi:hypothetical protein
MQKYLETIASMQTDYDSMFGDSATEERHLKAMENWRTQEDNGMRAARASLLMGGTQSRICLNFSDHPEALPSGGENQK